MRYCRTCLATYLSTTKCPRDGSAVSADGGDPLLGVVLGERYRVLERMAAGGMGQVYRASHVRIASLCAVKVLYGELALDGEMCARFQREAEAASMLQSRFITRVIDFGEIPFGGDEIGGAAAGRLAARHGAPYLVMELLDGVTLTAAVARAGNGLAEDHVLRIFRRIALGLSHAHERGIVHRDLKPDNVMLVHEDDEDDVPKLLDFGIARVRQAKGMTMAGQVMGTPAYMAPEQFFASDVDARADLYALGVLLFEMLTGRLPFEGTTPNQVMQAHLTAPVPPLGRDVSAGVGELLAALLAKKAEDRPASAREVIDRLDAHARRAAKDDDDEPTDPHAQALLAPVTAVVDRLRATIQKGAPLYNRGDEKGCAELYRSTASELMQLELAGETHAALRARLRAAIDRADGREPARAAWELRYAFDDLLFAMTRPAAKREMVPDAASRYALGCPQRAEVVRVLDLAALIAARRYEAGHPDVVADFYCVLADALRAQLEEAKCCAAVAARLGDALAAAEDLQGGADVASLLGSVFDELRFEGSAGDVLEVPPAEAAVVASSEQIDEVGDVLVRAIGTGAAWYNAGDVEGCLRLYLQTCERVLATVPVSPRNAALRKVLAGALEGARAAGVGADAAAWMMRHAFDAVLEAQRVAKTPTGVSAVRRRKA